MRISADVFTGTPFKRSIRVRSKDGSEREHSSVISVPYYMDDLKAWRCYYRFEYYPETFRSTGEDGMQAYELALKSLSKLLEDVKFDGNIAYYITPGDQGVYST